MKNVGLLFLLLIALPFSCFAKPQLTLTLNEAILVALRENPNVQMAKLNGVLQKLSLDNAEWQFKPHYQIAAERTTHTYYSTTRAGYVTENITGVAPSASLLTSIGSKLTLSGTNNVNHNYNPGISLEIIQPLMRGFGRPIVEAALNNAKDSDHISHLTVENAIRVTVNSVITAYLEAMQAKKTLMIDQEALDRALHSLQETRLFIKAGRKPGVEAIMADAAVAIAKTQIENDKNMVIQVYYNLLTTMGINPSLSVEFLPLNIPLLLKKYHLPTLGEAKQLTLENDLQYQTDIITIEGSLKRNIMVAKDDLRWQLDLTASVASGNGTGGGPNAGLNSLVNGVNQTNSVALKLTIPIDDQSAKTTFASAKIALKQALLGLKQEKWEKETEVTTAWNNIFSAERSLKLSENSEILQKKTYQINFQKFSHGLIDNMELQTAEQQFNAAEQALGDAKINYIKTLVALDLLIGHTLATWNIPLNLPGKT